MSARRNRHRIHGNPFTVRGEVEVPNWQELYGRQAPMALDVGFGKGGFLLDLARKHPDWNVLGAEIRSHLVEDVLKEARAHGLINVYAILANANLHLADLVPDGSLTFVSLNFPDPWFKKRHHKRRVVQTQWLDLVSQKMVETGEFHVMSDFEPIAIEIRKRLEQHPDFESTHAGEEFAEATTTGLTTEREISHLGRGHVVYRLCYRRRQKL